MTPILWSLLAAIAAFGVGLILTRWRRRQVERSLLADDARRRQALKAVVAADYAERTRRPE